MKFLRSKSGIQVISSCALAMSMAIVSPAFANDLQVIARSSDISAADPHAGTPLSLYYGQGTGLYPQINSDGVVLFGAQTAHGKSGDQEAVQLYRYVPQVGVQYLLGDLDELADPNGQQVSALVGSAINLGYKPTITGDGEALLMCRLGGATIDSGNNLGLVRAHQGVDSALLAQNQEALGGLTVSSVIAAVEPQDRPGEQYLAVNLNAAGTESAVLHRDAAGVSEVARTGMEAPETGGARFETFPNALRTLRTVNAAGDAVISARLSGAGITEANNEAVYRYHAGQLELVARDGMLAAGDQPGCEAYSVSYARPIINASGSVAFHAGTECGGISLFSDRSGELRREAYADKLFDGPTGRFRLGGFLGEVTTAIGSSGDTSNYLKGFLADNGDLIVLSAALHEDRTLRSGWAIVRIALDGTAEIAIESSAQHSALGFALGSAPWPEQVSIAKDGTVLTRVQEASSGAKVLIMAAPGKEPVAVRNGDVISGYTVEVGGASHISGIALSNGKALADVRVRAAGDDPALSPRAAIISVAANGVKSLPVVNGLTTVTHPEDGIGQLAYFISPFGYMTKRNIASDSGMLPIIGYVQREGAESEQQLLLLDSAQALLDASDFDGNGTVNPADIFAFLAAFFMGDARADIDGDGVTAVADIFAYLQLFFQSR